MKKLDLLGSGWTLAAATASVLIVVPSVIGGCGSSGGPTEVVIAGGSGGAAGGDGGKLDGGGTAGVSGKGGTGGAAGKEAGADVGGDAPTEADAKSGCSKDADCSSTTDTPWCQIATGKCVPCEENNTQHACLNGKSCCAGLCFDTATDPAHCGGCNKPCALANADSSCSAGSCVITGCKAGFDDCDLKAGNGCETPQVDGGAGCACQPGASEACYTGAPGTENVGPCKGGTRTCNADGTTWGPCVGEVIPQPDTCLDDVDNDCSGVVNDGVASGAPGCVCLPNSSAPCYEGPPGTDGVGVCHGGTQTCVASGLGYDLCQGQVLPGFEICANSTDDNCNGTTDENPDQDGDGWGVCDGDCCDVAGPICASPTLVNPGAFEVGGNSVDDDCDGTIDNVLLPCDTGLASNSANGLDYAKAIDLCQTTTETPPLAQKKWGVISAAFSRADGTGAPNALSRSIRSGFGNAIIPKAGARLAVLSTGRAADTNDTNPAFAAFQGGQDMATSSGVPADWLASNGGVIPNAPGCPAPQGGNVAHDPIMLRIRIRVPTNAKSFSVMPYFFSSEYPEWVCSPYNDFFVALLTSNFNGSPPNPADKNLAFYDPPPAGPPYYPVGVNLAFGNTGLFRQCLNGATGCGSGSVAGTCNTCQGITDLMGTGFETLNPPPQFGGDPGYCGTSNRLGGGTGWLTTNGNVTPGETIEIRFATWDTGDQWYDSLVLLDNWLWSLNASQPGTGG
ncbi:MAG: hypothetical protein HY898_30615 [Deltaproteobacteria bacterium]|nr:hypothetical protein [Deltaproteobacteria bacterium]